MRQVTDLRLKSNNLVSTARAMERICHMQAFEIAYNQADEIQQMQLEMLFNVGDADGLRTLMHKILRSGNLNLRELKELAKEYKIPNWSRMNRDGLLTAIKTQERQNGKS